MNIRKYNIAIIAALILSIFTVQTTPLAIRTATQALTKMKKHTERTVSSRIEPYTTEIKNAFMDEATLLQLSFKNTRVGHQCDTVFNECFANPTLRKMVLIKAAEWTLTMPGFLLASSGDMQGLAGTFVILSQQGMYGMTASAALLSGAASWYAWDFGMNQHKSLKEKMINRDSNDINNSMTTWSL